MLVMFVMLFATDQICGNRTSKGTQDAVMTHFVAKQSTCCSTHSCFAKAALAFSALT